MSAAPVTPNPADEFVTFVQHQIPGLDDGTYELAIDQRIDDAGKVRINDDTLSATYRFAVLGDRFSLANPAGTIASVFPAPNATGEYVTSLANVVFTSPTFPWARSPGSPTPRAEIDDEEDVPTWLAVLVLDAGDAAAFEGLALEPVTRKVGDLFPPLAWKDSDLGDRYSYFEGAENTDGLDIDQTVDDPVQTIDIPLALFARIAPTLPDLALTAHVRSLSVHNKALVLGAEPPADPIGTYSIVVGNRLPANDIRSRAYLVSLEGLEPVLPATSDGGTLTDPSIPIERELRLAVLSSWVFNAKRGSEAFVDRLERLNGRTPKGPDAPDTNLRIDIPGAGVPIGDALAAGNVPLDHELRTDETTVSWYRGPLSPVDKQSPVLPELPIASPDAALTFDPTTGMLDATLAAAWTIGRLIALADKTYATALYDWKRGLTQQVLDGIERALIDELMAGPAFDARPERKALLHATMRLLAHGSTNGRDS